jgi:hypothetical protein
LWICLDFICLIACCCDETRFMISIPLYIFIVCPNFVGLVKCFGGCRCPKHTSVTSSGLCYGSYGLRVENNKFNITLGLT